MVELLFSRFRVMNVKLINKKESLNVAVWILVNPKKSILLLGFWEPPITVCFGDTQVCSQI